MRLHRSLLALGAVAASTALVACGETTVVEVSTTAPATSVAEVTTTTVIVGGPADLAAQLSERAFTLSTSIADGRGKQAFAEIEAIWNALSSKLRRTEFVVDLGERVDFMRNAVQRKRPADADKAAMHIRALVEAAQAELAGA